MIHRLAIASAFGGLNILLTVFVWLTAVRRDSWSVVEVVASLLLTAIFAVGLWVAIGIARNREWAGPAGEGLGIVLTIGGVTMAVHYHRVLLGEMHITDPVGPACFVLLSLGSWMWGYFARANRDASNAEKD